MSFLKDLSKALKRAPSLASTTAALSDVESRERVVTAQRKDRWQARTDALSSSTIAEIKMMDSADDDDRIELEQLAKAKSDLLMQVTELRSAAKAKQAQEAVQKHKAAMPGAVAAYVALAKALAPLIEARAELESAGLRAEATSLESPPAMAFDLAALAAIRPAIQPPANLWSWETNCAQVHNAILGRNG